MNLNRIEIIGRTTVQPELKQTIKGALVTAFSVATNNTFKSKNGEKKETTTFHNVVAFGKVAEVIAQYVEKGQEIYVAGRLEHQTFDRKDGSKGSKSVIYLSEFQFGQKAGGAKKSYAKRGQDDGDSLGDLETPEEADINPEDLPF